MEPEGSLPCSQEPDSCLFPEPDASNPYLNWGKVSVLKSTAPWRRILYLPKDHSMKTYWGEEI